MKHFAPALQELQLVSFSICLFTRRDKLKIRLMNDNGKLILPLRTRMKQVVVFSYFDELLLDGKM